MTQENFVKSEIEKFISWIRPKLDAKGLKEATKKAEYFFSDDGKEIVIEFEGQSFAFGWSEEKGIYDLEDENRQFDELRQEGLA